MKVLLSNDDGVFATGIHALFNELTPFHDTTIIAPSEERSTTGHSLSLDKPLRIEKLENKIYSCSGYPGDCVLVGLGHVLKESRPDIVISGINRGANLGQDLYYSGTIAAAREAAFHNVPSVAVSLVFESMTDEPHYGVAATIIKWCLDMGLHKVIQPLTLININVPNLPLNQIKGCRLAGIGFRRYSEEIHARIDARGREYFWIAGVYEGHNSDPESDCEAVDSGMVSITPHVLIDGVKRDTSELARVIERLNAKYFI